MNQVLQEVQASLQKQLDLLDGRARQLKDDLMGVEDSRQRVSGALAALGAKAARNKQRKASCTRDDVTTVVRTILSENNTVPLADLQELTKGKITAQGKSLMGFGLRMKEVLRGGLVEEVRPNVFTLAETTQGPAS